MRIRYLFLLIALALSVGCKERLITKPVPYEVVRNVVQPVPEELLKEHPIVEGPLRMCPEISAERKKELAKCNADKKSIRDLD